MYEELIAKLREHAEWDKAGIWVIPNTIIYDLRKAADAIEELSNAGSIYGKAWTLGYDAGRDENRPRWIPVTEKLPEKAYGCLAIVWDNNPYTGDVFLNYYPEFVGYDSGTWNDCDGEAIPLDVVYWMKMPKIPEPPKEE